MARLFRLSLLVSLLTAAVALTAPSAQATSGPFADWKNVSGGEKHTCGVRTNGKLYCWGNNVFGQLGFLSEGKVSAPIRVAASEAATWTSASAGSNHSCGIRDGGALYCWGNNDQGELGLGTNSVKELPTRVGTSNIWKSVSAGEDYTCGVKSNGSLYCWGTNVAGVLGDGTETPRNTPHQVGSTNDWVTVSASRYQHTCGIRGSGDLYCWGHNSFGQLGDGSTTKRTSPKRVGTFADWVAVTPGSSHTCGVRRNGKLYCWGQNTFGQVGIGALSERERTPVRVGTFEDWVGVGSGYAHSCGVRANGKLYCWGKYQEGQIGDGTGEGPRPSPTRAGDLGWSKVASGDNHNCGIRNGGELFCWGDNGSGQVGNPSATDPQQAPIRV